MSAPGQPIKIKSHRDWDHVAKSHGLGREFHQFLGNARGSLMELDTHLELALPVGYINGAQHTDIRAKLDEVGRILNGLTRSISSDI